MRHFLGRLVVRKLNFLAKLVLRRYKPKVVAVTGSVGKTTTKELIAGALSQRYRVRAAPGSYNSEFGVPLTILDESVGYTVGHWFGVFRRAWRMILTRQDYPEILVLEMGADHPGDIKSLSELAPPDVAVITNVAELPVHGVNYDSADDVIAEKSWLVRNLKPHGVAVLNIDNTAARLMRGVAPGGVIYYGLTDEANIWVSDIAHTVDGTTGTLNLAETEGAPPQTWLLKTALLGRHQLYGITAAVGVGLALEVPVGEVLASVADFSPPPGRGRLLHGRHGLNVIDETYNSSPQAVLDALTTLKTLPGPRWAVLGDMTELGHVSEQAHRTVGEFLAPWLDHLVVVGQEAKFIAKGARKAGMEKDRIVQAKTIQEAVRLVDPDQKGGTVLVKASQVLYLERIVESLLADPRDVRLLGDRRSKEAHRPRVAEVIPD